MKKLWHKWFGHDIVLGPFGLMYRPGVNALVALKCRKPNICEQVWMDSD